MDEIYRKRLVTTRAVAKAALTRLVKFIQEHEATPDEQAVAVRQKELPNIRDKFEGAQSELEIFEEYERHAEDRESFETMYFDVEAKMNRMLAANAESSGSRSVRSDDHSTSSNIRTGIKLPTIKLPTFNGDITQFRHYHDTFVSLIVNNESLENIQRFHYLLSSLTGEAHTVIANLPVTSTNFQVAFDAVCSRYNNPRLIASAHLKNLLNLPAMTKISAQELRALLNQALSNLNALKALELNVPLDEIIISQLILEKTETSIRRDYESTLSPKTFPTLSETCEFLESKCKSIDIVNSSLPTRHGKVPDSSSRKQFQVQKAYVVTSSQCVYCKQTHSLNKCRGFAQTSVSERRDVVKGNNLCFNCLKADHKVIDCKSGSCRICGKRHHTLVHSDTSQTQHAKQQGPSCSYGENSQTESRTTSYCALKVEPTKRILLSTAIVRIKDSSGRWQNCRALLDSGSQSCFMSEACAQRLKVRRQHNRTPVQGIGDTTSETKHSVSVEISSRNSRFSISVTCLILPKVTDDLPGEVIDCKSWNIPRHLELADPQFYEPSKIDILLGAEVIAYIQRSGIYTNGNDHPVLLETELGWIMTGRYETTERSRHTSRRPVMSCFVKTDGDIQNQLQKFWEIEEIDRPPRTREEELCEAHFTQNTRRDSSGRFIVRLPFREDPSKLGDSLQVAARRFFHLERRLDKHPDLKTDYVRFMEEYQELGHMELASPHKTFAYHVPHHPVFKESSTTTKLRVVFDCSAQSSTGFSLNNILLVGPTVQQDLCSIIIRFRTHEIAFTADIEKMYRQVQVDPQDYTYQRILWRKGATYPVQEYHLKTVTYGMASAPFLATRCLLQLATDEADIYPAASAVLQKDFYVDDCMSGCQQLSDAFDIQRELTELLKKGGFSLRKWCSNHPALLENVPPECRETQLPLHLDDDENVKTLGLLWHPTSDKFQIANNVTPDHHMNHLSKRIVLAIISSIFDPLGLISPIVIICKMFLQQLWRRHLTWDEPLDADFSRTWQTLYRQLPSITNIRIDRRVLVDAPISDIQLHGFCDASEGAYGCCIYLRSVNNQGITSVRLVCSKSRVAPLKVQSLPRLELCGALLLARLVKKTVAALMLNLSTIFLWTDSTIVLAWISAPPTKWKTFVANRVSEIQNSTVDAQWRHVASQDNPADLISRGCYPDSLIDNRLWWQGPSWLLLEPDSWPTPHFVTATQDTPEKRCKVICHVTTVPLDDVIHKFSRLTRLQRVMAYCRRFIGNCRNSRSDRVSGELTIEELQLALHHCIRLAQSASYNGEIHHLRSNQSLDSKSKLKSLNPILDESNLLRVGGRLQQADLSYDQMHQIILPPRHHLTKLIVENEHRRLMHAGGQLLLSSLRQRYWIINARNVIRQIVHHCLVCHKLRAEPAQQLMGQLPRPRVEAVRPFFNCGVDYAGPFHMKTGTRRSKVKLKCYVALFVCLATRAVHLEVVTDMSTQAFLAAFKRFVSRRGRCKCIYSDNGTNFVGADKELRRLLQSSRHQSEMRNFSDQEGIEWKFIPPGAPHFGGIWEAGVKSFKHHLRRVMGVMCLTYEELTTLTCQIEACLNSRPLIPLSQNPDDPEALTPGHYLIGTAITSIPQPDLGTIKFNLLTRWQILQQQLQSFWRRWSSDYLHHLQQRTKWTTSLPNVQPGALIILKEDNLPPLMWKLGVIQQTHPGPDGLVRVVTVRTSRGIVKRPINKLCPFPAEGDL